jgi:TPR repeat protein
MPEVPQQIQDNLAHLELEADAASELDSTPRSQALATYSSSSSHERQASYSSNPYGGQSQAQTTGGTNTDIRANGRRNSPRGVSPRRNSPRKYSPPLDDIEQPSFSPFPKVPDRPANVPPSDEENEAKLESARVAVLNSNDPEMQLAWAQDTLQHVEICQQNESRLSELRDARAMTPRIEHQLRVDAVNVVNFLADQHHPKAEFIKGMWLEFGKFGYRMDKKEAYRCYYRAAQGGYARAEYRIGMQFEYSNDIGKAIRHYQKGVELGDSASNYVSC